MEKQVNLDDITDVQQLKALKSDQYDLIENAKAQVEVSTRNINSINVRLNKLAEKEADKSGDDQPPVQEEPDTKS